jgi:hypothetical protein
MSIENINWKYIRLLYVATGIISGYKIQSQGEGFSSPWILSIFIVIIFPFMMFMVVAMNSKRLPKFWNPPNWEANPFSSNEPFQFFHTVLWQAIVTGVTGCLLFPWIGNASAGQSVFYIAVGIGGLLGILLSIRRFPNRFKNKRISTKAVLLGAWQESKP